MRLQVLPLFKFSPFWQALALLLVAAFGTFQSHANAASFKSETSASVRSFVVQEIRLEGLHYLSPTQVFPLLGIKTGQALNSSKLTQVMASLRRSDLFLNIAIYRDGSTLRVLLKERPVIGKITIKGSKLIPKKKFEEALAKSGIKKGGIFQKGAIEVLKNEMIKIYEGAGHYGTTLDYTLETQADGSVWLSIQITEKVEASVEQILFVGNHAFDRKTLLGMMSIKEPKASLLKTEGDSYNQTILQGDIGRIISLYQASGYLDFEITDHQVALSQSKARLYITLSMDEGVRYKIANNRLTGKTILPLQEVKSMLFVPKGSTYNQAVIDGHIYHYQSLLKNMGYLNAKVSVLKKRQDQVGQVELTFVVQSGIQKYVRHVNIFGNKFSASSVIRREILQQEGAVASQSAIDQTRARLLRLGYFKEVKIDYIPVPGTSDLVDIAIRLVEKPRFQIGLSLEYSTISGASAVANFSQNNFIGSGYDLSLSAQYSKSNQSTSFNITDPFVLGYGVSMSYGASIHKTRSRDLPRDSYVINSQNIYAGLSYPISNNMSASWQLTVENGAYTLSATPAQTIAAYIKKTGKTYLNYILSAGINYNTFDRGYLPTQGMQAYANYRLAFKGSTNQYDQINLGLDHYHPLGHGWLLRNQATFNYGRNLKKGGYYPLNQNLNLGGIDSLRGFVSSQFGEAFINNDGSESAHVGGNIRALWRPEIIVPSIPGQEDMQIGLFMDAGFIYSNQCYLKVKSCITHFSSDLVRASAGVRMTWYTPFAPISLSLGVPIKSKKGDVSESFQFALGYAF